MRKLLPAVMLTVVVAGVGVAIVPEAGAATRECRFGMGAKAMRRTVVCVSNKVGVSTRTALAIARRESNFRARARNSSSGACGIYQHIPQYWPGRYRAYSKPRWGRMPRSCYSGRTNIIVSMHMVRDVGWSPWA